MKRGADGKFVPKDDGPKPVAWSDQVKGIADEKVRGFAEKFLSHEDLAKAALDLRQQVSKREGFVRTPYDGMTEDETKAWRAAAGLPEAPEGYGLKLPDQFLVTDADKEAWGGLQKLAFEAGVPRKGLESVVGWYMARLEAVQKSQDAALEAEKQRGHTELRQNWGADYERNVALAARAAGWAGGSELQTLFEDIGLQDHPVVLKAMSRIGAQLAQHVPAIAVSQAQATDTHAQILAEGDERYRKGTLMDPEYQARRRASFTRLYPDDRAAA